MKPIKIYCELYGRNILVFHKWPYEKFIEYIRKNICRDFESQSGSVGLHVAFGFKDEKLNIIWTDKKLKGKELVITTAHEALHATVNILTDAGVPMTKENDESYCYYQGFLLNRIL